MDKVRVAVIGCGGISRAHINAHLAEPRSELVYCVDIDEEKAKEKAEAAECKWHTDYEAILDEVDAVDICTPVHLHAPMAIRAAQAGKHVMTEKIMARNLDEAEEMIQATDEAGVIFMVAFVLRYRREFMIMHEICTSGQLGEIHQAYVQTQMYMHPDHVAEWRKTVEMFPMGALMSHGCHYVDQLIWNVGEIVETSCLGNAFTLGEVIPGGDDTEVMINRHENGAVSAYVESWATPYPLTGLKLDVYGKEGSARVEYVRGGERVVEVNNADGRERVWEYDPNKAELMDVFGGAKDMHGQIAHFIECILDGKQPLTHGREGIKPMQVIAAATEAERRGETINVQEWLAERKRN